MTRDQLEHAIRAACDVAGDDEVYVFGSQAILASYPDAPDALLRSVEADISPKNRVDRADQLNAIGEDSQFHRAFGFYVHGIPISEAATLPKGWEARTVLVANTRTNGNKGYCLEGHDLAASKLAAFREKDRDFVRELLTARMVTPRKLIARIRLLPLAGADRERLTRWVDTTARDIRGA